MVVKSYETVDSPASPPTDKSADKIQTAANSRLFTSPFAVTLKNNSVTPHTLKRHTTNPTNPAITPDPIAEFLMEGK